MKTGEPLCSRSSNRSSTQELLLRVQIGLWRRRMVFCFYCCCCCVRVLMLLPLLPERCTLNRYRWSVITLLRPGCVCCIIINAETTCYRVYYTLHARLLFHIQIKLSAHVICPIRWALADNDGGECSYHPSCRRINLSTTLNAAARSLVGGLINSIGYF